MMPIIIATERDIIDAVIRRITVPGHCRNCGAPHPSTLEEVREIKEAVWMAVSTYRVKHVLGDVDSVSAEQPAVCCSPPDVQPDLSCCGGDLPPMPFDGSGCCE